jgi:hypothetical protein
VRSEVIVVVPPGFQLLAGMSEAGEDGLVQELVPEPRVDPKGGEANLSMNPFW